MPTARDTIFALSSAPGRAGIAVLRVSGPEAGGALQSLTQADIPDARHATLRRLVESGAEIDRALVLWFPAGASFTGEDVVEFHVHGGRAVVEAVLGALGRMTGLRPAEPGEFTRRAVENGKFDLTQAEALADLIDAETEAQRKQALRQYEGALAALYDGWRVRLLHAAAWAEAGIDFAEEEVPEDVLARARADSAGILAEIQEHLDDSRRGEIVRDGLYLTVIGPPNAGKSSLVNALARRDVAIVAATPGTTRDVVEVRLDLAGYPVAVADTAGLREAAEAVEAEGVRRALARAAAADIVVLVVDGSAAEPFAGLADATVRGASLVVWNKADLPWPAPQTDAITGVRVSATTGEGLNALLAALAALARARLDRTRESPPLTRARHRHALGEAAAALDRALQTKEPELMAEDLRLALRALGRITGRVDIEELLDVIFRDFCVGK
ncbi:MAG: tRNA uridine-5-carboxymethylaminomethyl(34) synthesis GTPase MnmE [Rhizomicrobium sp.]|jgi:tRNA modification GTPase